MTPNLFRVLFLTVVASWIALDAVSAQTLTLQQRQGPSQSLLGFSVDLDGDALVVGGVGVQQTRPMCSPGPAMPGRTGRS